MDNWSKAINGSKELFNPLQNGHLQQMNWADPYMSLQRTRIKSELWIKSCASTFFYAYLLSSWLNILLQCTFTTNKPSLGFIINQVNSHSTNFHNLAGKSLERKRIIVLWSHSIWNTSFKEGTTFLETDWQMGRSPSKKKRD